MTIARTTWLAPGLALAASAAASSDDHRHQHRSPPTCQRRPPRPSRVAGPPEPPPTRRRAATEHRPRPTVARDAEVKLEPVKYDAFLQRIAANKKAKYTLVDAWATRCGPCKENFPHLVEMHQKYADKGLAVVSLSLDDPTDAKAVDDGQEVPPARRRPTFTNVLLDEELRRRLRQAEHQRHPGRLPLRARRQGSEAVHHGRPEQPVHLRAGREGRRRPARRQAAAASDGRSRPPK